ncbi:MAG: hypothetical protein ACI88A_005238, partial [Paraglaciecola sp.]
MSRLAALVAGCAKIKIPRLSPSVANKIVKSSFFEPLVCLLLAHLSLSGAM